jgi:S1-C subfamily serine protease
VILSIEGHDIVRPDDLARFIAAYRPGRRVMLEVLRENGDTEEVQVTLGTRPEGEQGG